MNYLIYVKHLLGIYSSQDPLENERDIDGTVYFVPDSSSSRRKKKKRQRPHIIIQETQFSETSSESDGNIVGPEIPKVDTESKDHDTHTSDSDVNPPLIEISQRHLLTESESLTQDDFEDGNIPFVRRSFKQQRTSSPLQGNCVFGSSDTDVPNAQAEKYADKSRIDSSDNLADDSSPPEPAETDPTGNFKRPKSATPSPIPTTSSIPDDHGCDGGPPTSTPRESKDGAYSLISNTTKLSTL